MNDSPDLNTTTPGKCSPLDCCDWAAITNRAKSILMDPIGVWPEIKAESKSIKEIYLSYLIPLAVIATLSMMLGLLVVGAGFFFTIKFNLVFLALMLGMAYVVAFALKLIAPQFQGNPSETDTFKLFTYSVTAILVGGFFSIIPSLAYYVRYVTGLYSLYTLYQGIPTMTGITEKRVPFFVISIVTIVVAYFIVTDIFMRILGM